MFRYLLGLDAFLDMTRGSDPISYLLLREYYALNFPQDQ